MKRRWITAAMLIGAALLVGCETPLPPGAERGPDGTMAFNVRVDASPPGARIYANGQYVGETPLELKIWGDRDGTFHDFGSPYYLVQAAPLGTNQYPQARYFGTGHMFGPEDRIPPEIFLDLNYPPQPNPPMGYSYAPPPYYYNYGPYWPYNPYYYYGPSVGFYFGAPVHRPIIVHPRPAPPHFHSAPPHPHGHP